MIASQTGRALAPHQVEAKRPHASLRQSWVTVALAVAVGCGGSAPRPESSTPQAVVVLPPPRPASPSPMAPPVDRAVVFRGDDGPAERCLTAGVKTHPSVMLCLELSASAPSPKLALVLRDFSVLDPSTGKHREIGRAALHLQPGYRTALHETTWLELDASVRLGLIPLVLRGAQVADDARATAVVVVDIPRASFQDSGRTPWCRGCDGVATSMSPPGVLPRSIVIIQQKEHVAVEQTTLSWDGARITSAE